MQNSSKQLGAQGEAQAAQYLQERGYTILERNWRHQKMEVDLIAENRQAIVFVEVKTRRSSLFGEPELFVTERKQRLLVAAAQEYLTAKNIELEARFDIVAIVGSNNNWAVKHLEAAFYPPLK